MSRLLAIARAALAEVQAPVTPPTARQEPAARHWRIRYPDGRSVEMILSDPRPRAEVLAIRPGAVDAERIIQRPPPATLQEAAELRRLVNFVLTEPEDRAEAMQFGLADIKNALVCYRLLAGAARAGGTP